VTIHGWVYHLEDVSAPACTADIRAPSATSTSRKAHPAPFPERRRRAMGGFSEPGVESCSGLYNLSDACQNRKEEPSALMFVAPSRRR
jgi:hypothetical protein